MCTCFCLSIYISLFVKTLSPCVGVFTLPLPLTVRPHCHNHNTISSRDNVRCQSKSQLVRWGGACGWIRDASGGADRWMLLLVWTSRRVFMCSWRMTFAPQIQLTIFFDSLTFFSTRLQQQSWACYQTNFPDWADWTFRNCRITANTVEARFTVNCLYLLSCLLNVSCF